MSDAAKLEAASQAAIVAENATGAPAALLLAQWAQRGKIVSGLTRCYQQSASPDHGNHRRVRMADERISSAPIIAQTTPLGRKIRCKHIGRRFGMLEVLGLQYRAGDKNRYYVVRCDCGVAKTTQEAGVLSGATISCGCFNRAVNQGRVTHGHSFVGKRTAEYQTWLNIKARCYNRNTGFWKDYGGRGIQVSDRWLESFENFLTDMGPKPSPHLTIERNDVNGNYEKSNCRWATHKEQANNKRPLPVGARSRQSVGHAKLPGCSSRFKGVSWSRAERKWKARIKKNGITRNLGTFRDEADAATAYNFVAYELFGEAARLNMPL